MFVFEVLVSPIFQRFIIILILILVCVGLLYKATIGSFYKEYSNFGDCFRNSLFQALGIYIDTENTENTSSTVPLSEKYIKEGLSIFIYLVYLIINSFFLGILLFEKENNIKQLQLKEKEDSLFKE